MKYPVKIILLTFLSFTLYFILDAYYFSGLRAWLNQHIKQIGVSHIITYIISGLPLYLGIILMHGPKNFCKNLGLQGPLLRGMLFALLCTLPMFIGYAIVFDTNLELNLNTVLIAAVAAALFEELFFRGFLFGQLFRFTKLGFIPSVIAGALLFASVHLYQSQEIGELIGIFLTTFLGALLFSWVYAEWRLNIWVPIFLHFFMNLSWMLFSAGENALGGLYSNIFRIITIALVIALTILYKRRRELKLAINKRTIWMKKEFAIK